MNEFFPCTLTLFQIFFYVNSFFSEEAKIRFLDVLYNSEYFDTNISNFFFHKIIASQWGSKNVEVL